VDPLAALEKSTAAQKHMNEVQKPRIEALQAVADHYSSDPYSLSLKVRKRFREDKKIEKEKQAEENELKERYGLPAELVLTRDSSETREKDRETWLKARGELAEQESAKRRKLETVSIIPRQLPKSSSSSSKITPSSSSSRNHASPAELLKARILANTGRRKPLGLSR
jgi:coiled-coil domain-containing protein 130